MTSLNNKVVFITGGSSGYGKATAKRMYEKGANVIIAARDERKLALAQQEKCCTEYIQMDVTKPEDWERAYDFIKTKYGRLDILINNAGGGLAIVDTVDQSFEDIDEIIKLNLNSVIYGSKVFGQKMKEQRDGLIINIVSVCGEQAWPAWSVYAAAKWGVLGLSKGLYVELQPYNVRVTCMIPAAASTGFQKNSNIDEVNVKLQADDVAGAIVNICELPKHVVVEEMIVWGIDQVVNPL